MWFRFEIELRRRTPPAHLHIIFSAFAHWHAVLLKIRNRSQNFAQARFLFRSLFFRLRDPFAQFFSLMDLGGGVLTALFELGNLLGSPVATCLQTLRRSNGLPPLGIDGAKVLQNFSRIHSPLAQLFFHQREVVANKIQIEHSALTLAEKCASVHAHHQSPELQRLRTRKADSCSFFSANSAFSAIHCLLLRYTKSR